MVQEATYQLAAFVDRGGCGAVRSDLHSLYLRIVGNTARRWHRLNPKLGELPLDVPAAGSVGGAERLVETSELARQVLAALRPADRELLRMRYFEGLSLEECAGSFGVSVGALAMRQSRAVGRARAVLVRLVPAAT